MDVPRMEGGLCVAAWNPNGLRALFDKSPGEVQRLVATYAPDIIIWNEIKGNRGLQSTFDALVTKVMPGYQWAWNHAEKAGRHGTCVAVKPGIKILSCDYGFGNGRIEVEGRLITLELESCFVVGLYGVNSGTDRLQYKLSWFWELVKYLEILKSKGKTVVAMGDWNVAPTVADVYDAQKCQGCSGFLPEEQEIWALFMKMGWIDVYRYLNPNPMRTAWTWGHRTKSSDPSKAGKMYNGWRIDHCVIDQGTVESGRLNLRDPTQAEFITLGDYKGSDHCPIIFKFKAKGGSGLGPSQGETLVSTPSVKPVITESEGGRHREVPAAVAPEAVPGPLRYYLPTVVCLKRKVTGEVVQGCDVYIGRACTMDGWSLQESIWANPFKVTKADQKNPAALVYCLQQYEDHIRQRIAAEWAVFGPALFGMISQGRSLTLGCFCKKKGAEGCHGDVIVKILNEFVVSLAPAVTNPN